MKAVRQSAKKVLDILTQGLTNLGDHRTYDNAHGAYMPVHVELTDTYEMGPVFSVSHSYTQNSDIMRDPEMLFIRGADGNYYPIYYRQDPYIERFSVRLNSEGGMTRVTGVNLKMQAEQAVFTGFWMRNVKEQQGL